MSQALADGYLERLARRSALLSDATEPIPRGEHPFDVKNIYPHLPDVVRRLFDDGHYAQASFEALKFLETEVRRRSGLDTSGFSLMMTAFDSAAPLIQLNSLQTTSDKDEQEGFRFMFAGVVRGIRNPRGHDVIADGPEDCLDHLSVVSLLLRKMAAADILGGSTRGAVGA